MQTEVALLSKDPVYQGDFEDRSVVFNQFDFPDDSKYQILFAGYTYENWSGNGWVVGFDHEKKQFFEVHGSHCSCYGLEGQWDPEYFESFELFILVMQQRRGNPEFMQGMLELPVL